LANGKTQMFALTVVNFFRGEHVKKLTQHHPASI